MYIILINETIKALRESYSISQATLAKELHVTRSSVNAWEMGLSMPTTQYVVAMAEYFHVSSDYLLGITASEALVLDNLSDEEKRILRSIYNYFREARKNQNRNSGTYGISE